MAVAERAVAGRPMTERTVVKAMGDRESRFMEVLTVWRENGVAG